MDYGIIMLDELKKDIQYIELYSREEINYLNQIYGCFNELDKYYYSDNSLLLSEKQLELNNNLNLLSEKRIKYIEVLKNTIITYITTSKDISQKFSKEGSNNDKN